MRRSLINVSRATVDLYVATAESLDVLDGAVTPSIVLIFDARSATPFSRRCVGASPWGRAVHSPSFKPPTNRPRPSHRLLDSSHRLRLAEVTRLRRQLVVLGRSVRGEESGTVVMGNPGSCAGAFFPRARVLQPPRACPSRPPRATAPPSSSSFE